MEPLRPAVFCVLFCSLFIAFLGVPCSAEGDLFIKPDVRELRLAEGASSTLVCTLKHDQETSHLAWRAPNGQEIQKDRNEGYGTVKDLGSVRNSDGTYSIRTELQVSNFNQSGSYTCEYTTDKDNKATSITLTVVKEKKPERVFYYGNDTVTLYCQVTLDATFQHWLKHNTTLEAGEKYEINSDNSSLTINKLDRDDAADYTARYELKDNGEQYDCVVSYTAAPLVLDMDKSINKVEEETVNIDCDVKGWPHAQVTWLKGKEVIVAGEHIKFGQHNDVNNARLIISDLAYSDEGMYTCRAYSAQFNVTSEKSIKLRVKDKLAWLWPFLGIVAEVIVLVLLILLFEKIKKKNSDSPPQHPHEQ